MATAPIVRASAGERDGKQKPMSILEVTSSAPAFIGASWPSVSCSSLIFFAGLDTKEYFEPKYRDNSRSIASAG